MVIERFYNADLVYFLKNSQKYDPISIKSFFNKDLESFNKENYDFLKLFKGEQYFDILNAYSFFNSVFSDYKESIYSSDLRHECYLEAVYFKAFCIPKLQALIKPNLDVLAKNGLNYELVIEERKGMKRFEDTEIGIKEFGIKIVKSNKIDYYNNEDTFYNCEYDFDYEFNGVIYLQYMGNDLTNLFKKDVIELDNKIIQLANDINKYLQYGHVVAYNKILKNINYTINNVHLNNIKNDDKAYLSSYIKVNYGHLANSKESFIYGINKSSILVWKYKNDVLYFDFFSIFNLSVLLAKGQKLEEIALKHKITNAKSFTNLSYGVGAYLSFSLKLPLKIKAQKEAWQNAEEKEDVNIEDYTKYDKYVERFDIDVSRKLITLRFIVPFNEDIDKLMHNIYNELKDKIILKENVQKKMKNVL